MTSLLEIRALRGGYGRVEVLRGVDLQVNAGEMVALLGSNGAGKSTLNKMVCGLCPAWSGTVRFDGQDLSGTHYRDVVKAGLIQVLVEHSLSGHDIVRVLDALGEYPEQDLPSLVAAVQVLVENGMGWGKDMARVLQALGQCPSQGLPDLVNTVQDLSDRRVGLKVLSGQGTEVDTTTAGGKFVFGVFAALAEFERELIRERTRAGLEAARARGRKGGRRFSLTKAQVRLAQAAMGQTGTKVGELCSELGITRVTLYRYVGPGGELREHGRRVLGS